MNSNDSPGRWKTLAASAPAAYESLFVAACLPQATIPPEFFRVGSSSLGPLLSEVFSAAADDAAVEAILQPLQESKLWDRVIEHDRLRGWRINADGLEAIKPAFDSETSQRWAERVVKASDRCLGVEKVFSYLYRDIAVGCVELVKRWNFEFVEIARPLTVAASEGWLSDKKKEPQIYLQRAVQVLEKYLGANHLDVATALYELGRVQIDHLSDSPDSQQEAETNLKRAFQIRRQSLPLSNLLVFQVAYKLTRLYLKDRRFAEAKLIVDVLASSATKVSGYFLARILYCQAALLLLAQQPHEALKKANNALDFYQHGEHSETENQILLDDTMGHYYELLADINLALGDERNFARYRVRELASSMIPLGFEPDQITNGLLELVKPPKGTIQPFEFQVTRGEEIVQVLDEHFGTNHPGSAFALLKLGQLYFIRHGFKQAEPYFRRMMHCFDDRPDAPILPHCLGCWAKVLYIQKEYYEAESVLERALSVLEKEAAPSEGDLVQVLDVYAAVYERLDRPEEAAAMRERANKLARGDTERFHDKTAQQFRRSSIVNGAFKVGDVLLGLVRLVFMLIVLGLLLYGFVSYLQSC
jgi:tetratricopeptide (TPR) repeat protein